MSNIVPFVFEEQEVRTITDQNGNPWFVAKDVCGVLGLVNTSQSVSTLDDDEKADICFTDIRSTQQRNHLIVSEPGLYKLIGKSRKPAAKRFDRWVRHEVLPTIRKTGGYSISGAVLPDGKTWGSEAGHGFIDAVRIGVRSIFEDVLNVKLRPIDDKLKSHGEKLDFLVGEKIRGRRGFNKQTLNVWGQVVKKYYGYNCPACETSQICTADGEFYKGDIVQFDHTKERHLCTVEDGMPLCKGCHGKKTRDESGFHLEIVRDVFPAWLRRVKAFTKNKNIVQFKHPDQRDFFE